MIALCLTLAACSSSPPDRIDAGLLQPCQPIPPVPTKLDMGELLLLDIELAGLYKECAPGKVGLIEAVKEL
ncbi:hypothetical protein D9M68_605330 [compost metagenome]